MKRFRKTESYKIKQYVFIIIAVLIVAVIYLFWTQRGLLAQVFAFFVVAGIFIFLVSKYDFLLTLKEYERAVVFRFGRVSRVGGPGWAFLIPLIESYRIVDLRTQTLDIPEQSVITKDNVVVMADAVIYLYVNKDNASVIKSVIEIDDYKRGAELFVKSSIRDSAGCLSLQELISNIAKLNEDVKQQLQQITQEWGVSVESVELQNLTIPKEIKEAMHDYRAAEQRKLARVEGAKAHQAEIEAVKEAAESLSDRALSYYYIRALEKIAEGQSTKFIFPIELTRLAEAISGRMSGPKGSDIEELFKKYAPAIKAYLGEAPSKKKAKK